MAEEEVKEETPLAPNEVKQEDIQKSRGLFASRLATKELDFCGTIFHLQSVPAPVRKYCITRNNHGIDFTGLTYDMFRFGVSDITNLTDHDGVEVKVTFDNKMIEGKMRKRLSKAVMEGLPLPVISTIAQVIFDLDELSKAEQDRLAFFINGLAKGSDASESQTETEN